MSSKPTISYEAEDCTIAFSLARNAWAEYQKFRPAYPQSMLDLWFDYHRVHGGKFDAVHDVGAGGGILSESLAQHFTQVIVSDPGESNLALARCILRPSSQFIFHRASGEESWLPPCSVDFVAMGESFHWMDTQPTLAAAAKSLRPGGTFAATFYGIVLQFPQDSRLAVLMQQTEIEAYRRFFVQEGYFQLPHLKAAICRIKRGPNGIELPDEEAGDFKHWTRININFHGRSDIEVFDSFPEEHFPMPPSYVKPSEHVINMEDKAWRKEVDVDFVKGYLASLTLPYDQRCWELSSWVEFERIINEEFGGKVTAEWPVSILLATRK